MRGTATVITVLHDLATSTITTPMVGTPTPRQTYDVLLSFIQEALGDQPRDILAGLLVVVVLVVVVFVVVGGASGCW